MRTKPTVAVQEAFLTTREFSRAIHMSVTTVKRLCDAGKVAHVKLSPRGDRRIPVSELHRLLDEAEATRNVDRRMLTNGREQ